MNAELNKLIFCSLSKNFVRNHLNVWLTFGEYFKNMTQAIVSNWEMSSYNSF